MIRLASNWPWQITRCPRKWLCNNSVQCTPDAIRPCSAAVISICWSRTRAWLWWVHAMQITLGHKEGLHCHWLLLKFCDRSRATSTITTHVTIVVVAVAVAVAYWRTLRRWFDPAGHSCNLFQFVWTAKLVSHCVHAPQSTAHNVWPSRLAPLLHSAALLNQVPGSQTQSDSPLELAPSWLLLLLLLPLVLAHTNYSCLSLATAPTVWQ